MEWSKVKNIIILMLLVVNVLLLGQSAEQQRQHRKYQEEALEGAVEVLRRQGYTVETSAMHEAQEMFSLSVERDKGGEELLAQALLGTVSRTEEGVRVVYRGEGGSSWFRSDGSFSVTLQSQQYKLNGEDAPTHAKKLLTEAGLPCEVVNLEELGEGRIKVTVRQTWEGAPIFSCTTKLTYLDGTLTEVEGIRLVGTPVREADGRKIMDLPTALIRFMAEMRGGGHVFTRIERMTAGYQSVSSGRRMGLRPVWEVDTDVDIRLLDGLSGALSTQ